MGLAVPSEVAPASPRLVVVTDPVVQEVQEALREQAVQVEAVAKAGAETKTATNELQALVTQHRYTRLSHYALKSHWSPDAPPPPAQMNPEVKQWWAEWRNLREAQESQDLMAVQPEREDEAAPPSPVASPQ